MATSTLDPDNMPEPDRQLGKGHDTGALGPSDTSDTGSDVQSGLRFTEETDIGLDRGTTEDPDTAPRDRSAGPDIGDARLDSDTDAQGTGERATAGRDSDIDTGADINVDRIDDVDAAGEKNADMDDDGIRPPRHSRHPNRQQQQRRQH